MTKSFSIHLLRNLRHKFLCFRLLDFATFCEFDVRNSIALEDLTVRCYFIHGGGTGESTTATNSDKFFLCDNCDGKENEEKGKELDSIHSSGLKTPGGQLL